MSIKIENKFSSQNFFQKPNHRICFSILISSQDRKTNSLVCFLEEILAGKFAFVIYWPLEGISVYTLQYVLFSNTAVKIPLSHFKFLIEYIQLKLLWIIYVVLSVIKKTSYSVIMSKVFGDIKKSLQGVLKIKDVNSDNVVFKLFYKATFALLIASAGNFWNILWTIYQKKVWGSQYAESILN